MTTRSLLSWALGLGAVVALGLVVGADKTRAKADDQPAAEGQPEPGKGKRAQAFIAAFNRGDAKAVAGFWTPDGDLLDDEGNQYKGREEIEKVYKRVFADRKGAKLTITVTGIRKLADDVGIEDGITEVTDDNGPPSVGRFSAVLVKKDGEWYFESVRESPAQPPSHAKHFQDLEWLIGEWSTDAKKGEGSTASYDWAENGNFIVSKFATTINGFPVVGGTQWIGWDAADKQIRSWSFYSGGGFGQAEWKHEGNTWTIPITAKSRDGKKVCATNVLTKVDDDHATWQLTKVTVDGKQMPDPEPQKMKRVKAE